MSCTPLAKARLCRITSGRTRLTSCCRGIKRVVRVEKNIAADQLELSTELIERLNNLTPASGERHDGRNMAIVER